ncbi:MAG TPA: hypothetical protein VM734_09905, partial [Kofleriaceae bacterium]|nr:hypothetical protein [Kofleriaceae bacterium]
MSQRRILLIDADRDFYQMLSRELGPYGFEIVRDDSPDALGRLQELGAVALFISVEEPERKGYALFNKAKKGVAAGIPVVLVTSSVPADVFANHRRLKVHADEYLDKRDLSIDVLIGKIDNLLGPLDEPNDMALPVEVDEVPLDDDVLVDEVDGAELDLGAIDDFADEGNRTMEAPPQLLDSLLEAETDAAFAGLMLGEEPARKPATAPPPVELAEAPPVEASPRPLPPPEPEPVAEPQVLRGPAGRRKPESSAPPPRRSAETTPPPSGAAPLPRMKRETGTGVPEMIGEPEPMPVPEPIPEPVPEPIAPAYP